MKADATKVTLHPYGEAVGMELLFGLQLRPLVMNRAMHEKSTTQGAMHALRGQTLLDVWTKQAELAFTL